MNVMPRLSYDEVITRLGQVPDKKRRGAEAALLLTMLAVYVGLWAQPNVSLLDALNDQLAQAERSTAEQAAFAKHFELYEQELAHNKQRLVSAHELLPDDPDIPQFLARLGTMANALDITIERLEPGSEVVQDFYAEIPLHVQVRGTYHQVATLIDQVSNQARIVNVSNVTFTEPKAKQQKVLVDGRFDVKIFRFLTDEQLAAAKPKEATP